jgi:hypothetical protein
MYLYVTQDGFLLKIGKLTSDNSYRDLLLSRKSLIPELSFDHCLSLYTDNSWVNVMIFEIFLPKIVGGKM